MHYRYSVTQVKVLSKISVTKSITTENVGSGRGGRKGSSLSRLHTHVTFLHGHENLSFARIFKHCGLKISYFKPLKCNRQQKRIHFAISCC